MPASDIERFALTAALTNQPWMPINDQAALYKFAQKNELGPPQTKEFDFQSAADKYIGQVFHLGIVYVKKGDWDNVRWVRKPMAVPPIPSVPNWYTPLASAARPAAALPLKDFPRPPNDNGRGIHFGLDFRDDTLDAYIPRMNELGIKWTLLFVGDEMQAERAGATMWNAGIMPVIRPKCWIDAKQPLWQDIVTRLKNRKVPAYVQIYNEPGDDREWRNRPNDAELPEIFAAKWANAAIQVFDAGGFPGLQILGIEEFTATVNAVRRLGRTEIWNRVFFALHNYGANHPPAYPYDVRNQQDNNHATILTDDTAVLNFIEFAKWMQDQIGFVLPFIGGEGGWQYGAEQDKRYAKCEGALHAQYHREMFEWFSKSTLSNGQPLPDYLFSVAPWILFGYGFDDWYGGPGSDKTATLNAVKAIPPFVRKFSWEL